MPTGPVPVARAVASQSEFLKLLASLDSSERLCLLPASSSLPKTRVVLQSTYKDAQKDRFIGDARPANAHEAQLKKFLYHIANASMLLETIL